MNDKSTFYSPYGDDFWDNVDLSTRDKLSKIVDEDSKKGIFAGIFLTVMMIIAFVWGVTALIDGKLSDDLRMVLFLLTPPIIVPAIVSAMIRSRRCTSSPIAPADPIRMISSTPKKWKSS